MSYSGVEHKLRVFISSKCGGKYTIARKALKKLLEATGLVEAYVFETEPASSEDTQSAYLEYVDGSNLCIFLVDNEDDVPPAVLSEEKRAKDKHLRRLYLFCDENKKEKTPMQDEVRAIMSQKYCVVHEFSDIVSVAYDSVMQDIIAVYKRKEEPFPINEGTVEGSESKQFNIETHSILPSSFSEFPDVCRVLTKGILPINPAQKAPEETLLEKLLSDQLQAVLFLKQYDDTVIDGICAEVQKENSGEICELLKLRYQAQKNYFSSHYTESLSQLQNAISIALNSPSIPTWIANDIAIDIRHVQGRIDEQNSSITIENPGQKYIDDSGEPVYFPYLDRQVENMQEEIAKKYFSQLSASPYSTSIGGIEQIFAPLSNAFCIAQLHGSIVQSIITLDRLISIYSMLCTFYEDHDLVVEYIRLLITNRDGKKLDSFIRTYNQAIDILNGKDIDTILVSINHISNPLHRIMSKYLLASRLGYYMNDAAYSALYGELVEYAMNWARDDNRVFNANTYIFDFFRLNTHRSNGKDTVEFLHEVFNHGLARFYMDCFKVLSNLDFVRVDSDAQNKVKQMLVGISKEQNEHVFDQYYSSAIIWFCKNTDLAYEDMESIGAEKYPNFYNNTFLLEMASQRGQDFSKYVNYYLDEAQNHNKTQGMSGTYSGYAYDSLDVVFNILNTEQLPLTQEMLKRIIDVGIETLAAEKQTIQAKRAAVNLLQFAYFQTYEQEKAWDDIGKQLIVNAADYSVGYEMGFFSKDTNDILSFHYNLFVHGAFEPAEHELILERLYSVDSSESYTIIESLKIITAFLKEAAKHRGRFSVLTVFSYNPKACPRQPADLTDRTARREKKLQK